MSYNSTRLKEQLRVLDHSIDDFVDRYNVNSFLPGGPPRQTLFLFPGGMGSRLRRATKAWQAAGGANQTFKYDDIWLIPESLLGGARDLKLTKVGLKDYQDQGKRIIVADGIVGLLGFSPYTVFKAWCTVKQIDWFVYPWDWRRSVDDVGAFFVNRFLPHFRQRVQAECNNQDPLADFSLIGHSAGGMVANWVLRDNAPIVKTMRAAITVGTPFYGYQGQLHRWFEGEDFLNGFGLWTKGIVRAICSFPGCYAWHFMSDATFQQAAADLSADPHYPLAAYPSVDTTTGAQADPYDPKPNAAKRYPSKSATGFDIDELDAAAKLTDHLASPLLPALAQKFFNLRGVTKSKTTLNTTTWNLVPPTTPSPIVDETLTAGDTVQPAWTARHAGLAQAYPAHVITIKKSNPAHGLLMNLPATLQEIAKVLQIP